MYREPIVIRRKLGLKSTVWTRRKKETSNQKGMKKQEFKKMRRGLGTSRTTFNSPTSESAVPEAEEEVQEIENLLEKIMKENFPSLAMEINFSESPRQLRSREEHTKVPHNYTTQD